MVITKENRCIKWSKPMQIGAILGSKIVCPKGYLNAWTVFIVWDNNYSPKPILLIFRFLLNNYSFSVGPGSHHLDQLHTVCVCAVWVALLYVFWVEKYRTRISSTVNQCRWSTVDSPQQHNPRNSSGSVMGLTCETHCGWKVPWKRVPNLY